MRLGAAAAFVAVMLFPPLLECFSTCPMLPQRDYVEGHCPVNLTPLLSQVPGGVYSECVTVHVWITADDFCKNPRIEVLSPAKQIFRPIVKKGKNNKCAIEANPHVHKFRCVRGVAKHKQQSNASFPMWESVIHCVKAEANSIVSVSYGTTSSTCSVSYVVPDPVPEFDLFVDRMSKSITVSVNVGEKVQMRWCYQSESKDCWSLTSNTTTDSSQSQSAVFNIPYLLPCVCVQVYYTYRDASRNQKCPFQNEWFADAKDVWRSSEVLLYESSLTLNPVCPASGMNISAALCWKHREHLCIPVFNSTLKEVENGQNLIYDTSAVDKHPNMCVQFSLQGSHNISCPFQTDMPSWEVYIGLGKLSVFVYLTSVSDAVFSTQLCVLNEMGCSPMGTVNTIRMEGGNAEMRINMASHFLIGKHCVQVWQTDPARHGRRVLCPDYTHNRRGLYALAALILVFIFALLAIFIQRLTRSGAAGWLYTQGPVLLVCSSEHSAHVSAVCALASVLQGELNATVHMSLWAQSSQRQTGAGTAVADMGPLPWLYGQWENVRRAQGKVLIIWSPEAKTSYEAWKENAKVDMNGRNPDDDSKADVRQEKKCVHREEDQKLNGRRLTKSKVEDAAEGEEHVKLCDAEDWYQQKEPSSVILPVFAGALACLQGSLQKSRGQEVAIVYFQGLGQSRDIPKALRGVPRYCLPQNFRGLLQELGGMKRGTKTGPFKALCCPRLLAKMQSIWLARQLAHRLQTLLPQAQGGKSKVPK